METGEDATVITFPPRHPTAAQADIGAALTELDTGLQTIAEQLRGLSIAVDRSLQFGHLNHIGDPITFTADLSDIIDGAARTVATAENQIQTTTELWNRANKQL